jgi:hypothetical protein
MHVPEPPTGYIALFRIVESTPPSDYDLMSHQARGRTMRVQTARARRLWSGLSVYRTEDQAHAQIGRTPMLGRYIVELHIPMDGSVQMELDNGPHGHSTVWGDVATIRGLIVAVTRV